jgi:ABC-type sugar transport system permease subunit
MYGEAAAMSYVLLVIALIISVINAKILTPKD